MISQAPAGAGTPGPMRGLAPRMEWKGALSMSMPSFPIVDPPIGREDAVNQILSSIAMEDRVSATF